MIYKIYESDSFEFWGYTGWFFASRIVEKELGSKMHYDNNMTWVIAINNDDCVGISCIQTKKGYALFKHSYVLPLYRGCGIYKELVAKRLQYAKENNISIIKTYCTDMSKGVLELFGFVQGGNRGRYSTMELKIE